MRPLPPRTLPVLLIAALVAACDPVTDPPPGPATLRLRPGPLVALAGERLDPGLTAHDGAGEPVSAPAVAWSSTEPTVADVVYGRIVAGRAGTATLAARAGELTAELVVEVRPRLPLGLPVDGVPGVDYHLTDHVSHPVPGREDVDFACGPKTTGSHEATDFSLIDRDAMTAGVAVIAAAAGVVEAAYDAEPDRMDIEGPWPSASNRVELLHPNGLRTSYERLKQGSVRVEPGQRVDAGDVLGLVGNAGPREHDQQMVAAPHLHFVATLAGRAVDPFAGPCGGAVSQWTDAPAYDVQYRLLRARAADRRELDVAMMIETPPAHADTVYLSRTTIVQLWAQQLHTDLARPAGFVLRDPTGQIVRNTANAGRSTTSRFRAMDWNRLLVHIDAGTRTGEWTFEYWYDRERRAGGSFVVIDDAGGAP